MSVRRSSTFVTNMDWSEGLIFLKNDYLEIRPLRNDFASLFIVDNICVEKQMNLSFGKLHFIKKLPQNFAASYFNLFGNFKPKRRHIRNTEQKLIIELAVFVDATAYFNFMHITSNNEKQMHNIILAYVNQIQAVFHQPSLGVSIDISLVELKIMKRRPSELFVYDDLMKMRTSFCKYAETLNPSDDNNLSHWDIVLLITGIDTFVLPDSGEVTLQDYNYMGESYFNAVCRKEKPSCAIVEYGSSFSMPTALASSAITAAYQIGNILGITEDKSYFTPNCADGQYIMSNLKNFRHQRTWSECSRKTAKELWNTKPCLRDRTRTEDLDVTNDLDHSRYHEVPGREWTAKAQCELYLRDIDANVVTLHDICKILQCELYYKYKGNFFAGPALDGTYCALGKECRGGECVPVLEPPYIFKYCDEDNWSEWKEDNCQSSCLEESKGAFVKRRSCKHGVYRTASCGGPYYDVALCDDKMFCPKLRITIIEFTRQRCNDFVGYTERVKGVLTNVKRGPGSQAVYDVEKPWMACIIICQQKNPIIYNSHLEMLDRGFNPYFPDGTLCHRENGQDYYCRKHYCLPENYSYDENDCSQDVLNICQ
ncbi:A disintegrin and metalloproteinase with thrombospondin motifs 19-like isoform X2 [Linepithema humile]|uniref:A disintegrin and metalloproteinase with thrombospondin motifs 19-like isoform X2 n=1 Tax=Linepithema humile TaxID=83485 RepID=UPI00351E9951